MSLHFRATSRRLNSSREKLRSPGFEPGFSALLAFLQSKLQGKAWRADVLDQAFPPSSDEETTTGRQPHAWNKNSYRMNICGFLRLWGSLGIRSDKSKFSMKQKYTWSFSGNRKRSSRITGFRTLYQNNLASIAFILFPKPMLSNPIAP